MKKKADKIPRTKLINVWADWSGLGGPTRMGELRAQLVRGKEVFSFEYASEWLGTAGARVLDPALQLYAGPQYAPQPQPNFGLFLDSSPDRWGRVLMQRREAHAARMEGREQRPLFESDYLLGVFDENRIGGIRFTLDESGPFLDDDATRAAPPWARLRELEAAVEALERDDAEKDPRFDEWLRLLIAPGSSLGGARPKAAVVDEHGHPWIAKFPSRNDRTDVGAWEFVVHALAREAGIRTPPAQVKKLATDRHTFLVKRFDRGNGGERIHFASAMTLLQRRDGEEGASYLELARFIIESSEQPAADLEQLWRRIVFFICISNTDDHLRNHGFLLGAKAWLLAPAYDVNPVADGSGLTLNISETDNALDLELAREVAPFFRIKPARADHIIDEIMAAVGGWRTVALQTGIRGAEQDRMARAFRASETK